MLTILAILNHKSRSQRKYSNLLHKGLTRFCLGVEYSPVNYKHTYIVDTIQYVQKWFGNTVECFRYVQKALVSILYI